MIKIFNFVIAGFFYTQMSLAEGAIAKSFEMIPLQRSALSHINASQQPGAPFHSATAGELIIDKEYKVIHLLIYPSESSCPPKYFCKLGALYIEDFKYVGVEDAGKCNVKIIIGHHPDNEDGSYRILEIFDNSNFSCPNARPIGPISGKYVYITRDRQVYESTFIGTKLEER